MSQRVLHEAKNGSNSQRVVLKAITFSSTSKWVLLKFATLTACHKVLIRVYTL